MEKKKRLLFVNDSLGVGGGEKSLVTLLNRLDYSRVEVDLQLFRRGGAFERYLPPQVNVLPLPDYLKFTQKPLINQVASGNFKMLRARLGFSLATRIHRHHLLAVDMARLFWTHTHDCFSSTDAEYDVAIAYAQNVPTYYAVDKARAKKKVAWINILQRLSQVNHGYAERFYAAVDNIVTVSDMSHQVYVQGFPQFADKTSVIWDIQDAEFISRMADDGCPEWGDSMPCLLTVARLNKPQKGYDIALEACRVLRDRGLRFRWYAVGDGPFRAEMERFIASNELRDTFVLLGSKANPYPYIKHCTLYVQTSREEGYGLSIAEARILNRPVVTTEFDTVYNQMVPGKNGLVVPQDPVAVADAVQRLLEYRELYNSIMEYQRQEKKGNTEEVEKFYRLIDLQ